MKVGISFASTFPFNQPDTGLALARAAERAGFESLWAAEHVVVPSDYESPYPYSRSGKMPGEAKVDIPDPLIWLAWIGARTSRIRLGTGILVLPQRNPLVTAKAFATLDAFSGGRVEAGVGVGWLREEFDALGVPFAHRGSRTDEYIEVLRTVWSEDDANYAGDFVSFQRMHMNPKPMSGMIPITIGGHSPAAARRAGRLGDGFYPGLTDADHLQDLFRVVRRSAEEAGRDPASIVLSAPLPRDGYREPGPALEGLAAMGVGRAILPAFMVARPDLDTGMAAWSALIAEFG